MNKKLNNRKNYRRCLSCRHLAPKDSFLRVVRVYPSHNIQLNEGMGRSAYICPTEECVKVAQSKKRLPKNLKTNIPEEFYSQLWQHLSRR